MIRLPRFGLALATLFLLGGCASYKAPRLTVTDVRLTDQSPDGLVITFFVSAENANRSELPLRDVTYSLYIDGQRVFNGSRSPEATLARLAIQELRLPAAVPLDAKHPRPTGPVPYRIDATLTYITPGKLMEVLYDSGIPPPTTSFSHTGTIDLSSPAPGG